MGFSLSHLSFARRITRQAEQAAEKMIYFVVPNEVRNISFPTFKPRRDSSARSAPRNEKMLVFPQKVKPVLLSAPHKSR
jgi:hypothetical protein